MPNTPASRQQVAAVKPVKAISLRATICVGKDLEMQRVAESLRVGEGKLQGGTTRTAAEQEEGRLALLSSARVRLGSCPKASGTTCGGEGNNETVRLAAVCAAPAAAPDALSVDICFYAATCAAVVGVRLLWLAQC